MVKIEERLLIRYKKYIYILSRKTKLSSRAISPFLSLFSEILIFITPASKRSGIYCFSSVRPSFRPSFLPSITKGFVAPFSAAMHHNHFKLGMVLPLRVLHVAYRIHVRESSTSCFTTQFVFQHNMVKCPIFVALWGGILGGYTRWAVTHRFFVLYENSESLVLRTNEALLFVKS